MQPLEEKLYELFVKQAPSLPRDAKRTLVQYLPWIDLVLGVMALYTVYAIWHWAHTVNALLNYANTLSPSYGGPPAGRLSLGIWLGLIVLTVEMLLYLAAFPGMRDRKKAGWNLLFYALLLNIVYGVVVALTSYGGFVNLFVAVVGSGAGLYLLFQVRSSYSSS